MNEALLSSKNMNWCTPQDFFDKLNDEFHFELDAAATDKSAKCKRYFTPETNGLAQPWTVAGGGQFFAILRMAGNLVNGSKKRMTNRRTARQSFF